MQYMCTNFVQEMERQGVHGTNIRPLHLFQCCDIFRSLPVRQTFAVYRRCIGSPILTRLPSSIVGQFTDSNLSAFIVLLFFGYFFLCFFVFVCTIVCTELATGQLLSTWKTVDTVREYRIEPIAALISYYPLPFRPFLRQFFVSCCPF